MARFNFDETEDLNELAKEFERMASKEKQVQFVDDGELPVSEEKELTVKKARSVPAKIAFSVIGVVAVCLILFLGGKMLGVFHDGKGDAYKTVPDVIKKDITRAREVLYNEGFRVRETYDPSSNATPGEVIKQNQPPGTKIKAGANIVLTVAGKAPRDSGKGNSAVSLSPDHSTGNSGNIEDGTGNAILVVIPNLEGMDKTQATQKLEALGLYAEEVPVNDEERQPGIILGSDPAPESSVAQGSVVKIQVSKEPSTPSTGDEGNPVTIPDYFGESSEDAIADLKNNDLIPIWETEESSQLRPGIVIRTEPGAGSTVDAGTEVTVVIAR